MMRWALQIICKHNLKFLVMFPLSSAVLVYEKAFKPWKEQEMELYIYLFSIMNIYKKQKKTNKVLI